MVISEHHVNNVLRVYGELLFQGMISNRTESTDANTPERISISAKTRRKTIVNEIISNIIEKITQSGHLDNAGKEVFNTVESGPLRPLTIKKNRHNEFIFKEIDGNNETINSLSIEDSKILINKLMVIAQETTEKM